MDITIPLSAKRCFFALALGTLLLLISSLGASLLSFVAIDDPLLAQIQESVIRLTWVDEEGNIPAWYSASLLLLCSVLLAAIASAQRHHPSGGSGLWLVLSLIFLFLSLDETAQLHELSIQPLRDWFGTTGFLHFGWIIPGGLAVGLVGIGYLRFLGRLPTRTRQLFLLAAALYVGGAIGVEAISGKHASVHGESNLTYHLIITLEELLEMSGLVVFIYALLDYIGGRFRHISFQVARR